MQYILDLMKHKSRIELRKFNKIDRCVLVNWLRKRNYILKHIKTKNIADTNILIKAVIVYIGKKISLEACGSKNKNLKKKKKKMEPWWKKRIKEFINKLRKLKNI